MRAKAPGKIVLSGAYAVLEGARAIVAAVDRYALADSSRPAPLLTPEVAAALGDRANAPWFDASALREGPRKLGLGSSAAILVASLGALALDEAPELEPGELARRVLGPALAAHRSAQGGGSGIDVAASVHGGVLIAERVGAELRLTPTALPADVRVHVLAADAPASTPALIRQVQALRARDAAGYHALMARQASASERAASAALDGDGAAFVAALAEQGEALAALGAAAGAGIVTDDVARLAAAARIVGAAALPAGAGGGDIALWVTHASLVEPPPSDALRPIALELGARGLSAIRD